MVLTLSKSEGVDFRLLHQAADQLTPKLRRTLLAAFENLPEAALTPLIAALEAGRIDDVMALLAAAISATEQAKIAAVLTSVYVTAANLQGAQFNLRFDLKNPAAVRWAERNAAQLVTGVAPRTQAAIRDIVVRGIQDGIPPAAQARELRQLMQLSTRDAVAADNFYRGLLEQVDAAGGGFDMEDRAFRRFMRYRNRLVKARMETIARTETIRAANRGQLAAWESAADAGLLDRTTLRLVWVATEDSRVDAICSALDGTTVGFGESFSVPQQDPNAARQTKPPVPERSPPAHPRCRCSLALTETVV